MLRTLLTPRWLGFTALAVLAVVLCLIAAWWQYQRTQDQLIVERAAAAELAAYPDVVTGTDLPLDVLGREVRLDGELVPEARSFVRTRTNDSGEAGFWVVDGVRLDDGRTVPLLQGWVEDPSAAPKPEVADLVSSTLGRVQPDENFYRDAPITPAEPLVTITSTGLASQWPSNANIAPGYVTATSANPDFERIRPVFGADPDVPFPLQNALYSLQWIVFAGLVLYVWFRGLRIASRLPKQLDETVQ